MGSAQHRFLEIFLKVLNFADFSMIILLKLTLSLHPASLVLVEQYLNEFFKICSLFWAHNMSNQKNKTKKKNKKKIK